MKLSVTKKFFHSIQESISNPIIAYDLEKNELVFSSGLAEEILGYSQEELEKFARSQFIDIIHPDDGFDKQNFKSKLSNLKDGEVLRYVLRLKKKDGTYVHFQINDRVYERDANGNPIKISSVAQDITELAHTTEELKKAVDKIDAIRYKNSHSLRAPVATIIGILDLIKDEDFENECHRTLIEYLRLTVTKLDDVIREINKEAS